MFDRILVALDFSRSAWLALETARTRFPGSARTLLYVQPPGRGRPSPLALLGTTQHPEAQALRDVEDQLQPRESFVLGVGNTVDEILRTAHDREADLIVLGTHGRQGLSQLVLGSVAAAVVRRSPVPVLTVRLSGPRSGPA
ncbi:universal stress protein [Deinococcus sp. NW-56]|uniref:universal stress protein n=1 Tax=Deinococcus sp. NW-56 TaxID=2080419 RepID=UPI000CF4BDE3|nr:universal stress protein [Deinococcus sp. NW-56]